MRKLILAAFVLSCACVAAQAKEISLLWLGNSFTQNATRYLPRVVASFPDCKLSMERIYYGGTPIGDQWNMVENCEQDENRFCYKSGYMFKEIGQRKTLRDLLQARKWDVVVALQQYGPNAERFSDAECEPYGTRMYEYVKKYSPDSEIMIHQTWAYREGWAHLGKFGKTTPSWVAMYDTVNARYVTWARKFNLRILPSGAAMKMCQERHPLVLDPNFDYSNPKYLDLPKEQWALHVGPIWRPEKAGGHTFIVDYEHASPLGEYMMACLWFEMLYGEDAREVTFRPEEIPEAVAKELRSIAHETATTYPQPASAK